MEEYNIYSTVEDINVDSFKEIITPNELLNKYKTNTFIKDFINESRNTVINIMEGEDKRKIVIVGPCSIHNVEEAKIYATKLKELSDKINDKVFIIMRVYFEKPRTITGWKGLINDPDLNETFDINKGLHMARELLLYLAKLELPAAYEVLDTFTPQYISDLITWSAVGARTTESQVHRQLVSGLSMPVGFKNSTNGDCKVAIEAMRSASHKHCFNGITYNGKAAMITTKGNQKCHIILRGSSSAPNYYKNNIQEVYNLFEKNNTKAKIVIDCSHGNSNKDFKNQSKVWEYILDNYLQDKNIFGYMLESNINEGNQKMSSELKYGVSITDSCISFNETIVLLNKFYELL